MVYLELLWSFFQIGLFSFGGGYAALPLIQTQVVDLHGWLNMTEFVDIITISQMTPGPIAINASTFVGMRIAGVGGAVVATLGCVLPSCIIVLILAYLYYKYRGLSMIQGALSGLRPAVVSLIASSGMGIMILAFWGGDTLWSFAIDKIDWVAVGIFAVALFVLRKFKLNPIYVMLGAGALGLYIYPFLPA